MTDFRYTHKIRKYDSWWKGDIKGSQEEKMEDATIIKEYTYKLLDYADKDELPEEEVERHKRLYQFARQGPKAWHHRFNVKNKITSADVLYLLTTNMSSERVGKLLGINGRKVRAIRSGFYPCWEWEYQLIKRIKAIVHNDLKDRTSDIIKVYSLSKVISPTNKEELYLFSSMMKAKKARKDILSKTEYNKLTKNDTLDILYPIEPKPLL